MSERIIDSETGEIVSDGAIVKADWYGNLVDDCKAIITEGTFNSRWALVEMYWNLGSVLSQIIICNGTQGGTGQL